MIHVLVFKRWGWVRHMIDIRSGLWRLVSTHDLFHLNYVVKPTFNGHRFFFLAFIGRGLLILYGQLIRILRLEILQGLSADGL